MSDNPSTAPKPTPPAKRPVSTDVKAAARGRAKRNGTKYTTALRAEQSNTSSPAKTPQTGAAAGERAGAPDGFALGFLPFPAEGTPECAAWHKRFRAGDVIIGRDAHGNDVTVDLTLCAHLLVGGAAGSGKSALLRLFWYGALMNPDIVELVVVDPPRADFSFSPWAKDFPNVTAYTYTGTGLGDMESVRAIVEAAYESMLERQQLLREHGAASLGALRRMPRSETGLAPDSIPGRMLVLFNEGGAVFTSARDTEARRLQDETREALERIAMLGRASEVNIVMSALKPSAENIGTALRNQFTNRVAVGKLNPGTSIQTLGTTTAATALEGAPKGRGIHANDNGVETEFQAYFLTDDTRPDPTDPGKVLYGVRARGAAWAEWRDNVRLANIDWKSEQAQLGRTRPGPQLTVMQRPPTD